MEVKKLLRKLPFWVTLTHNAILLLGCSKFCHPSISLCQLKPLLSLINIQNNLEFSVTKETSTAFQKIKAQLSKVWPKNWEFHFFRSFFPKFRQAWEKLFFFVSFRLRGLLREFLSKLQFMWWQEIYLHYLLYHAILLY